MKTYVKLYPREPNSKIAARFALPSIVEYLAEYFRDQVLGDEFHADPACSVAVPDKVQQEIADEIERGLLIGAFVNVAASQFDVPTSIRGSRLRLSFMLSPAHKLLLRNYRPVSLDSILAKVDPRQIPMFAEEEDIQ